MRDPVSINVLPHGWISPHEEDEHGGEHEEGGARKAVLAIAVVLALVAAGGGWYLWSGQGQNLETVRPVRGKAVLAIYGTGEVEPRLWAKLSPTLAGRLMAFEADEGDAVKAGQVLARLDDTVEKATLAEFEARLAYYAKQVERQRTLVRKGAASRHALDLAASLHKEFIAKVAAQKERIARLAITSPIDGIVLRRDGDLGELIQPGRVIFWVGQAKRLRIVATIDEEDIPLVRVGQKVLIKADAFPDRPIEGKVEEITLKGDPVAKTFRIRVSIPEGAGLLIGMTVEVNVIAREVEDALLVPVASVHDGKIYVLREDGRVAPVAVKTGIATAQNVEITAGLEGDERILANPEAWLASRRGRRANAAAKARAGG